VSPQSHSLAVTVRGPGGALLIHAMFNAYWEPLTFEIPRPTPGVLEGWRRWIDTYRDAPDDVCDWTLAPYVPSLTYAVQPRSLVTLVAATPRRPTRGLWLGLRGASEEPEESCHPAPTAACRRHFLRVSDTSKPAESSRSLSVSRIKASSSTTAITCRCAIPCAPSSRYHATALERATVAGPW